MATNGKQVDIHFIDVDWEFSNALGRICMEENLVLTADCANLFDGLHNADFVIHVDH